jgi:hypothetical protein
MLSECLPDTYFCRLRWFAALFCQLLAASAPTLCLQWPAQRPHHSLNHYHLLGSELPPASFCPYLLEQAALASLPAAWHAADALVAVPLLQNENREF